MPSITRFTLESLNFTLRRGGNVERLHDPPAGAFDRHPQVRGRDHAFAAVHERVGQRRVGDRHLQRVGLQVALADGQVHVVPAVHGRISATIPHSGGRDLACAVGFQRVAVFQPLRTRQHAFGFVGEVDPRGTTDPQLVGHVLDHRAVAVVHLADFEEVRVRGDLERFHESQRAVVHFARVAELLGADGDAVATSERCARVQQPRFEARDRGDRLERRAGRVVAFGRAVEQRNRSGSPPSAPSPICSTSSSSR